MRISVFGASSPQPGSDLYKRAHQLGRDLASRGHTIMNGGYIGTMEAVSRGARENNGHVIGVTCNEIEKWRSVGHNQWITEEKRFDTVYERLKYLVTSCDTAVALPGGIGTLTEIMVTWNLIAVNSINIPPIILISDNWKKVFSNFFSIMEAHIPSDHKKLLTFSPDIESALDAIIEIENHLKS